MKETKRNNYDKIMNRVGIHTLSGYTDQKLTKKDLTRIEDKDIKKSIKKCNFDTKREQSYLLINPNKTKNGEKLITQYSDFLIKMNQIFTDLGMDQSQMHVTRADFCFNSSEKTDFEDYKKLHRLLLSCLACAYDYKNVYHSQDLFTWKSKSMAIKRKDSEAENYDKYAESNGKDESCNRLELRSLQLNSKITIEKAFAKDWCKKLDKACKCFEEVQMRSNDALAKLYLDDREKPTNERKYFNLTAFLLQYQEGIYCRKQMIDLLSRFPEVNNPANTADHFKEKHRIEYFSKADLRQIIKVLKKKTKKYFEI